MKRTFRLKVDYPWSRWDGPNGITILKHADTEVAHKGFLATFDTGLFTYIVETTQPEEIPSAETKEPEIGETLNNSTDSAPSKIPSRGRRINNG